MSVSADYEPPRSFRCQSVSRLVRRGCWRRVGRATQACPRSGLSLRERAACPGGAAVVPRRTVIPEYRADDARSARLHCLPSCRRYIELSHWGVCSIPQEAPMVSRYRPIPGKDSSAVSNLLPNIRWCEGEQFHCAHEDGQSRNRRLVRMAACRIRSSRIRPALHSPGLSQCRCGKHSGLRSMPQIAASLPLPDLNQ